MLDEIVKIVLDITLIVLLIFVIFLAVIILYGMIDYLIINLRGI
jgi:hypothetical protein